MAIPEAVAGGLIAGGATVLAAGGTGLATGLMNKKTRQWNERMIKEQRQYNEKLYNLYESPAAQVRQLAAAGYNPYATEASTQAVGKSSSIPTWNPTAMDFSGVAQAGQQIASSYHARKAQERQLEFQQKQLDQVALDSFRNYMLKAAEGVRDAKELEAKLELVRAQIDSYDASTKAQKTMNDMLDDFKNSGGNTFVDESNYKQAQTKLAQASANLNDQQRESIKFALDLSEKFDEAFIDLSLRERQQQVQEFLDSADIRQSMLEFAKAIQQNAKSISDREVALNELQSRIVRDMLTAVEQGMNSDDIIDNIGAVLAFSYVNNPTATISAISSILPNFTWNNNNKNTYNTTKNFGNSK